MSEKQNIRNVAIIAHVDHGKTTLVDALLRQSKTKLSKEISESADLIMDSNDLERERGITIFSKNAAVSWSPTPNPSPKERGKTLESPSPSGKGGDGAKYKINIIDTPGHADFGGEVERILSLADGALLLVDAKEGPMPQTRFVLKKALAQKLKIIVVINKIDKPDARGDYVLEKTLELFLELGASNEQLNFPVLYASAKNGLAGIQPDLTLMKNITPVFEMILREIQPPSGDSQLPLQIVITSVTKDQFKGRVAIGRIYNGTVKANQEVVQISRQGRRKNFRLTGLMTFEGLGRVAVAKAMAGDLVALAGLPEVMIGDIVVGLNDADLPTDNLPVLMVEEPTVKVTFCSNNSPFAGREGQFTTSRQLRERLMKELENDMALRIKETEGNWEVAGRGELHLAIFIERLRREGYELQVSRPQVIEKNENGKTLVPFDCLTLEIPEDFVGLVIQKLGPRHAQMQNYRVEKKIAHLEFLIPTRGLFGYRQEFLTDTKGLGIMHASFEQYAEDSQSWLEKERGSLVAHENGETIMYSLMNLQERGVLFYGPGVAVYKGQVVGEHSRAGDLSVNVCKAKHLTNFRSKGDGGPEYFHAPRTMDLEDALEYIGDDELVEVTPKNIRIRKIVLDPIAVRRQARGIKV